MILLLILVFKNHVPLQVWLSPRLKKYSLSHITTALDRHSGLFCFKIYLGRTQMSAHILICNVVEQDWNYSSNLASVLGTTQAFPTGRQRLISTREGTDSELAATGRERWSLSWAGCRHTWSNSRRTRGSWMPSQFGFGDWNVTWKADEMTNWTIFRIAATQREIEMILDGAQEWVAKGKVVLKCYF